MIVGSGFVLGLCAAINALLLSPILLASSLMASALGNGFALELCSGEPSSRPLDVVLASGFGVREGRTTTVAVTLSEGGLTRNPELVLTQYYVGDGRALAPGLVGAGVKVPRQLVAVPDLIALVLIGLGVNTGGNLTAPLGAKT